MLGIGWRKRTFRKYFGSEDNYTEFHKVAHRLLEAPTIAITQKLQDLIEDWLRDELEETRAADWWRDYWTGEHGNYTNATAGYVGNNKSTGIESHWRYMRRDTVGSAGSSKRVSTRIFAPSLTQYVSDLSKRHADKILDAETGAHRFPMLPTISTKLWGKVQKFDIMRLLLSTSAGSKHAQKAWLTELDYFHGIDTDGMMYTDIIKKFREDQDKMHVPRSTLEAIVMPTPKCLINLRRRFAETYKRDPTFEDYQEVLAKDVKAFLHLFNDTDTFQVDFPQYHLDDILELMECFHHIRPLPVKSGDQVFLCTCCDAYQSYCCVESTALSLLYNTELEVPDLLRRKQIKDREKVELANPFTAQRIRDEKKKKEKGKAKAAKMWKPHMPVFSSCAPGSAADMATQKGKLKTRTALSAPARVPTPADASLDPTPGHSETLDPTPEDPTLDPKPVDPKTVDPKPVDPKLLVTSRGRGPPARRSTPAKVDKPGRKVRGSMY